MAKSMPVRDDHEFFAAHHLEDHNRTTDKVLRVQALARKLFDLVETSDLSVDERLAAKQIFNVLHDRIGTK